MNMKKLIFGVLALSILTTTSCKKEEVIPPPTPTSSLSSYFTDNEANAVQTFTFDATVSQFFTGTNGVQVYMPANSFVYSNGTAVSGNVTIELTEVLTVSEMVKLNKTTTSNGQLLVSGGQLNLEASQNGNQLLLAPGMALNISVPVSAPDAQMALFTGNQMTNGDILWTSSLNDTDQQDSLFIVQDSIGGSLYNFDFNNDSLGWINCDYWWNTGQTQTFVTAVMDTSYNYTNTACYLVLSNINAVVPMYNISTAGEFETSNIPINQTVTFVCISEIDNVYYSSFVSTTLTNNHIENISMVQTTLTEIETAINNL
jgi:hypothetical protein